MRRTLALLVALTVVAVIAPEVARADTASNDEEVELLARSVFDAEYKKKQYVEALEKLQLASSVCQEGSCSAKVRAKILVAVGTVLSGGLEQVDDGAEVFKAALKEDPKVGLIDGYEKGKIEEAWKKAKGIASSSGSTEVERKSYPGNIRPQRGYKTGEGYFFYSEALAAEERREWALCSAYAGDSMAAEPRISTRYLRAKCLDRGGKWIEALADYREVAEQAPRALMKEAAKDSKEKSEELSTKMPRLMIRPPPKAEGLEVRLDDEIISNDKLGGELWVNPGQHRLTATGKSGDQSLGFEQDVVAEEGKSVAIELKLVPKESTITDSAIMRCFSKAKSREELAKCIGQPSGAAINVRVAAEFAGYHDSDNVDVLSPAITANVESAADGWSVGAGFLVDVVTAASADIVATASPRWTEIRYVPNINGRKKFGDVTLGLSGNMSIEPDYLATGVGANFAIDLADKTITPQVGYDFGYDISGRSGTSFSTFSRPLIRNGINLGVSLVLDKATALTLMSTLVFENGDSSKPYRYVPMFRAEDLPAVKPGLSAEFVNQGRLAERVLEQLPTDRQRYAVAGLIAHRFTDVTLRVDERLYIDSWGVKASTTDITLPIDIADRFRIWPHGRAHLQTGADFWQIGYTATPTAQGVKVPALRTGDRELGPLIGLTGGAGARLDLGERKNWGLTLTGDMVYTRFLDHLFIQIRYGFFGALMAEVDFE